MRKYFLIILTVLFIFVGPASCLETASSASDPEAIRIIEKIHAEFKRIKDAEAELELEYNLHLFGCTGVRRIKGKGYYKYPDKIKIMDHTTYFARGNKIRKIDKKGKRFYVKLTDALDFSAGFHPGLITHNFNLWVVEKKKDEIILLGIPKPGILKNVGKVYFYIDPFNLTLKEIDVNFKDKRLNGKTVINYETINGITVPVGLQGNSAIALANGTLVGVSFKLRGENIKLNTNLAPELFDPGF